MENKGNKFQKNNVAKEEKIKNSPQTSRGIRCYGKTGFLYPEKQPDGTIIQRFCYGREGD